jgi:hypothetical protein
VLVPLGSQVKGYFSSFFSNNNVHIFLSSIGSSLSMEMPPLFSNGVIGQTTSHLVSRETDLSLNSLLSRSQSIFGHAAKSIGFVNFNSRLE